jgi:hypothetical protein
MMRALIIVALIWPCLVKAEVEAKVEVETWQNLDGAGVTAALAARVLRYGDGAEQNFFADGRTLYSINGTDSWGHWRVQGDQYCSNWPPSDRWDCYDLAQMGLQLRFSQNGAPPSIGHYIDLN